MEKIRILMFDKINLIGKLFVYLFRVYLPVFVTLSYFMVGIISADDTCRQSGYGYIGIKYSARQPYNCTLYTDPHNPGENECAVKCSRLKTFCPFFYVKAGNCTVCVSTEASNTTIENLTIADYSLEPTAFIFEKQDKQNQCSADICLNNGTCIGGYLDYHCNCTPGFVGKNCGELAPYSCREVGDAVHVSAGLAGVWALSETSQVLVRHNEGWTSVYGALNTISSGLILCGCFGSAIYCKQGFTADNPGGGGLTQVSDGGLTQVDVNINGNWWGLNEFGDLVKRANPESSWIGAGWNGGMGSGYKHVTIGGAGVWVITSDDQVNYRIGTYEDDSTHGSAWQAVDLQGVDGSPQHIESTDGYVWICTDNHEVYKRAVSADQPEGVIWVKVPELSDVKEISIESASKLWGITSSNKVMECAVNV